MKNNAYWKRRMEMLETAQLEKGQRFYADLERQYRIASANIEKEINNWYQRFAENNQITMAEAKKLLKTGELAEFKWNVQEYIKYGEENALNQQWMKELENASARVHISRLEALKIQLQQQVEVLYGNQSDGLDKLLRDIYSEGYYHTAFEIQRGFNIGWDLHDLDSNQLDKILSRPWSLDGRTFSDRIWVNKQQLIGSLQTQLTQAVIRGESPDVLIKNLAQQMNVDKNKAGRLIMTESAAFASAAQKDCFKALDVEKYEIVATLDNRTSQICQDLDGEVFDMKDYQVGVTAPPFHPWCRTTTVPYFEDNYGERAARGADGKTYYVPSNMKYADWKKTFVNGGSKDGLKEIVPGDNMKIKKTFKEKIQEIKASIANKGGIIEENDIKQAGKLLQDELQMKRADLKAEIETLQKQYKETGIEDIEKQLSKLRQARRGLIDLDEVGLKDMDSLNEKYNELMTKKIQLNEVTSEIETKLREAEAKYRGTLKDNAKELKEKLSEVRDMGIGSNDIDAHLNNSRSPMRKVVKDAYDYYPTDWIKKSVENSNLSPKKVDRGYYNHYAQEIAISGYNDESYFNTAIHEFGHRFERVIPGILETEKVFYERRTVGEPLKWLGGNYDYSEKARFDKFLNPYMGKDYGGTAYELVSMGFEYAYTNPTKLWEDEDYATWIYGILLLL
jgi:SPP1 gp7 family putative phage head morphogenesis protein